MIKPLRILLLATCLSIVQHAVAEPRWIDAPIESLIVNPSAYANKSVRTYGVLCKTGENEPLRLVSHPHLVANIDHYSQIFVDADSSLLASSHLDVESLKSGVFVHVTGAFEIEGVELEYPGMVSKVIYAKAIINVEQFRAEEENEKGKREKDVE